MRVHPLTGTQTMSYGLGAYLTCVQALDEAPIVDIEEVLRLKQPLIYTQMEGLEWSM